MKKYPIIARRILPPIRVVVSAPNLRASAELFCDGCTQDGIAIAVEFGFEPGHTVKICGDCLRRGLDALAGHGYVYLSRNSDET